MSPRIAYLFACCSAAGAFLAGVLTWYGASLSLAVFRASQTLSFAGVREAAAIAVYMVTVASAMLTATSAWTTYRIVRHAITGHPLPRFLGGTD